MKKSSKSTFLVSLVLFIVSFLVIYLSMCYLVPGFRIKLSAPPLEYFLASIQNAVLFKTVISTTVSLLFTFICNLCFHRKNK